MRIIFEGLEWDISNRGQKGPAYVHSVLCVPLYVIRPYLRFHDGYKKKLALDRQDVGKDYLSENCR